MAQNSFAAVYVLMYVCVCVCVWQLLGLVHTVKVVNNHKRPNSVPKVKLLGFLTQNITDRVYILGYITTCDSWQASQILFQNICHPPSSSTPHFRRQHKSKQFQTMMSFDTSFVQKPSKCTVKLEQDSIWSYTTSVMTTTVTVRLCRQRQYLSPSWQHSQRSQLYLPCLLYTSDAADE